MNGTAPFTEGPSNQVDVIDTQGGRILCIADVRGKLSTLNALAIEHNAKAIIHTGDFGFYEASSLSRVSDRTLKHLIQYSNLITPQFRAQLLAPHLQPGQLRQMLTSPPSASGSSSTSSSSSFALSEFPLLLSGELKFIVPVYTVWGACEDVSILEKLRAAPAGAITVPSSLTSAQSSGTAQQANWSIPNLTVLSESCSRALVIGNVRFRLFGLGGACVQHKLFDNGEGQATIAGGGGTMWTTMLQIGELVDTAQRVYDPTETRILITHASPGREGMLAQLGLVVKADLSISASLHFRYGVSYNEFSVQHDQQAYRNKFVVAKTAFNEVWDTVKTQVEAVIDEQQRKFLSNAIAVVNRLPSEASPSDQQTNRVEEEAAWKNQWNWNLPDAAFGSLVLDVKDGRVCSEMKSQGFNFSYRAAQTKPTPTGPSIPSGPKQHHNKNGSAPSGPKSHHQNQQSRPQQSQQTQSKDAKSSTPAPVKPAAVSQSSTSQAPAASTSESKDAAPAGPSLANTGAPTTSSSPAPQSTSTPNIDRPNSSASGSRRPSSHQHQQKSRSFSRDETSAAGNTDSEGNASASKDANGHFFPRGRGRGGRGRGEGRGGFDGPKRGGGRGSYRGGHQGSNSTSSNTAPSAQGETSSNNTNNTSTKSETTGPAAAASTPAAKSGEATKPNGTGVGWE